MSFSAKVKEELAGVMGSARHCQIAEAAALFLCGASVDMEQDGPVIHLSGDNQLLVRKFFTICKKTFNIEMLFSENESGTDITGESGGIRIKEKAGEILQAIKCPYETQGHMEAVSPLLLRSSCCRRAALRGLFIGLGSMSNPRSGYHLEFVCANKSLAEEIVSLISSFELEAKVVERKKYYVAYIKEGAAIVDLLNVMEAHVSLMELENLRILKDISNSVNRRVNCEAANILKTVSASSRQLADIELIDKQMGLANLPDNLREAALVRLELPDSTLAELAQAMDPPIGRSGMNHRLRKLSEIAEQLRS